MDLRDLARDQECQIRIPSVCSGNTESVVLCHYRLAGTCGTGIKPIHELGAWGCFSCHAATDGRLKTNFTRDELRMFHAEGVMRTLDALSKRGYWLRKG